MKSSFSKCATRFATLTTLAFAVCLFSIRQASGEDEILKTYRAQLYRARENVIRMLEAAVQEDQTNVDYWIALIHALDVNGELHFADRAARLALKVHPDHPELLIARAKVLDDPAAWDQLEALGQLPGQQPRAELLKELLSVYLLYSYGQPRPPRAEALLHAEWAERLLEGPVPLKRPVVMVLTPSESCPARNRPNSPLSRVAAPAPNAAAEHFTDRRWTIGDRALVGCAHRRREGGSPNWRGDAPRLHESETAEVQI